MKTVYVRGDSVGVDDQNPFGEGGEAIAVDLGNQRVIKLFRQPNDPFFNVAGEPETTKRNQEGCKRRMSVLQRKLPAFPKGLPDRIVGPTALAWSKAPQGGRNLGKIVGYEMPLIQGNVLADFATIDWREENDIDNNQIRDIHLDWLTTIEKAHMRNFIFGDVNPYNEIVTSDGKVFIIDADSAQWDQFLCETFTARFVDPLICHPDQLIMVKPHSRHTDLYAFDCIFWSTSLYVGPWEGTLPLKTKDLTVAGIRPNQRALKRISAMHPEVIFPAWAPHWSNFPDEVLDHYDQLLNKDRRGVSMRKLLENLRWTHCTDCGHYHARPRCPKCAAPTRPEFQIAKITKNLEIERVLDLVGAKLLSVVSQDGKLRYLYHKDGQYYREFGAIGLKMPIERDLKVELSGDNTMVSAKGRTVRFSPGVQPKVVPVERFRGQFPQVCGTSKHFTYLRGGQLTRESASAQGVFIDSSLANQTMLWSGEHFGLMFYLVGGLQKAKVFEVDGTGSVPVSNMPELTGNLLNATCYFSKSRAWLFVTTEEGGKTFNSCFVIKPDGQCSSSLLVEQGDPDHLWLSGGFIHLGR
ncbi:MAG: hypothetical protein KDD62_04535, partial [Bdellovibrionales bacterium]|nr:hypothetical protein [Bdellovibrionales bacterium]